MKKAFSIILCSVFLLLSGCNFNGYDFVDTNYHFNYAWIELPTGEVVEGKVVSWADAEGEQLTITLVNKNGKTERYLCSSMNCVLLENID